MIDVRSELELRGVLVKPTGKGYGMCLCPFHSDLSPSLSVDLETGSYRCFAGRCGVRGEFHQLIAELDGISEAEAQRVIRSSLSMNAVRKGVSVALDRSLKQESIRLFSATAFKQKYPSVIGTPGERYLSDRGLVSETMRVFGIRWGSKESRMRGRVVIPMLDSSGRLVAYVGRSIDPEADTGKKVRKEGDPSKILFGLYNLLKKRNETGRLCVVYLVEGEIDALYLQQLGVPAVSVAGTSQLTPWQYRDLRKWVKKAVIAYDGDEAGFKAGRKEFHRLKKYVPTGFLRLPWGMDPNDLGIEGVREVFGYE